MNPLIKAWIDAESAVAKAHEMASAAEEAAESAELPKNLRPAKPSDIVEGAVLWYPEWDDRKWSFVGEVLRPSDPWKGYSAHDGCRYGLDGAFVETDSP